MTHTSTIDEVLKFDPLQKAEDFFDGISYKDSDDVALVGLFIAQEHNKLKKEMLEMLGDTTFSNPLDRYLEIVKDIGFEQILSIPFSSTETWSDGTKTYDNTLFCFMHREDGILLTFDTYHGNVNGGKFYYCWRANEGANTSGVTSSSSPFTESGVWPERPFDVIPKDFYIAGDHDCREALRHKIRRLREVGTFLNPWPHGKPFLWLLHHEDTKNKDYDYQAIGQERIAQFPQWARDIIGL